MPKLLCKTVEVLHIEGRGTVVALEERGAWRIPAQEVVQPREAIRILRPDQSSVKTFIKDLDCVRRSEGGERFYILLPHDVGVDAVPAGSLIFLEREGADPVLWDGRKAEISGA